MRFGGCKRFFSLPNIAGHRLSRGTGGAGEQQQEETPHRPEWEEGEGRNVGRIQKKLPQEAPQQRAKGKASTALQSGNVGEQKSLGEKENGEKSGIRGKRDIMGSKMGNIPSTC